MILISTVFFALVCSYLIASLGVFVYQEKLIFWPKSLKIDYTFNCSLPFEELFIDVGNQIVLNCVHIKCEKPKGCIMYHHGNSENLSRWINRHSDFTRYGYDVFMYDYRGYGKSNGKVTELNLYNDSQKLYNYLKLHYKESDIVQYGISLGSGIAAKLSNKVSCEKLILETPYYSLYHMAEHKLPWVLNSLLLNFHIRTDKFIRKFKGQVLVIHGDKDELIPYEQGVLLSRQHAGSVMSTIAGGMHNNLNDFDNYHKSIEHFLFDH